MKIKSLLIGMLACTALVGCTSDDDVLNNELDNGKKQYAIKISLNYADGISSRSHESGDNVNDFEEGLAEESDINSINLHFYDVNETFLGNATALFDRSEVTENNNVTRTAIVAFTSVNPPTYVVAHVNGGTTTGGDLSSIQTQKITDPSAKPASDYFYMTNSVYKNANNEIIDAVTLLTSSVKEVPVGTKNEEVAQMNDLVATDIHVERVAAKVTVENSIENSTVADEEGNVYYTLKNKDNNETAYAIGIHGWKLNATNKEYYAIKNVGSMTNWKNAWNAAEFFRSYWAEDPNYTSSTQGTELTSLLYQNMDGLDAQNQNVIEWNALTEATGEPVPEYCYENTVAPNGGVVNTSEVTHVIIKAQYMNIVEGKAVALNADTDGRNIYRIGQVVWTENNLKKDIAAKILAYYKVSKNSATVTSSDDMYSDVTLTVTNSSNEKQSYVTSIALANGYTVLPKGSTSENDAITEFKDFYTTSRIDFFEDGFCVYTIPVKHFEGSTVTDNKNNVSAGELGYWGVVRNHWYQLDITSIAGFGEPETYNKPIVPDPEVLKTYAVKCRINVLAWSIVSQSTAIGGGNEWK